MKGYKGRTLSCNILSSYVTPMISAHTIAKETYEVQLAQFHLSPLGLEAASKKENWIPEGAGTALTAVSLLILLLWGVKGLIREVTNLVEACKDD